jgi:hypothetical protein
MNPNCASSGVGPVYLRGYVKLYENTLSDRDPVQLRAQQMGFDIGKEAGRRLFRKPGTTVAGLCSPPKQSCGRIDKKADNGNFVPCAPSRDNG